MIVSILDITAKCPRCGGTGFDVLSATPLELSSELKCSACDAKCTYLDLLDQIGEEAMRRANEALEDLKKHPSRPRGPKK